MPGQRWVLYQPAGAGYLTFPTLSDELRRATYPLYEFRQFVRPDPSPARKGEVHYFNRIGRVTTIVQPIGEQEQFRPLPAPSISRGQLIVDDYGAYFEWTERLERFAEWDVQQILIETLKLNMQHNLDFYVAQKFKSTPIKAIPVSASAVTIVTSPPYPQAGAAGLTNAHVKDIIDFMRLTLQVPPYDGTNYVCIAHGAAIRVLHDQISDQFLKYTSPDIFYTSEVAQWYGCRFVQTNNSDALSPAAGTGPTKTAEAIFLAFDPIIEAISVPEEIRLEVVPGTFGRIKRVAWFFSGGWALTWDTPNPGECRVVHFTSG